MDWKAYYGGELRDVETRDKIKQWLLAADVAAAAAAMTDPRTVFSFPHTFAAASGPLQARVVAWLYRCGFKRVIALGVMHGSLMPVFQATANERLSQQERLDAFAQIEGAFLPEADRLATPFGHLPVQRIDLPLKGIRMDRQGLLETEFSLDTFHAILRFAADVFDVAPMPVIPAYVGMTRNPVTGAFDTATGLACWLRNQWDDETAIVTTGDVVHYGRVYGSEIFNDSPLQLEAHFRHRLDVLLELALREEQMETAFQMCKNELASDQREILPVLARLVGDQVGDCGEAQIEAFELSDYAAIFETVPPCLVASALIVYKRHRTDQESRSNDPRHGSEIEQDNWNPWRDGPGCHG